MEKSQFDAQVIGFGRGGSALADFLGKKGMKVAVVEKSKEMYGGSCINIACMPTKSLVLSAEHVVLGHHLEAFTEKERYYRDAIEEKRRVVTFLRQKVYDKLATQSNISIIDGVARFLSPREIQVAVSGAQEEMEIQAENVFIDTGTLPYLPSIAGLHESQHVYTSTSLMELQRLPRHLLIVGAGYVGLEFASIYRSFGSKVTVLEQRSEFLPGQSRDIVTEVKQTMEKQGIQFHLNAHVQSIHDRSHGTAIHYLDEHGVRKELEGDAVLVAVGRVPNTSQLALEKAGIAVNERGFIEVDEYLRTNVPNIWAIGDVNGGPEFTYISLDDYRIIREQFDGKSHYSTRARQNVPSAVFISPTLSHVGLTEEEALQRGYEIMVGKLPAAAVPRAQIMRQTDGLLKAIVDARTNKILGATLYCADSHEMIQTVQMAMHADMDYRVLRDNIFAHPSMSEALNDLFNQVK